MTDLTLTDTLELLEQIEYAAIDRDASARAVANLVADGDPQGLLPYATRSYIKSRRQLELLRGENNRRIDARRAATEQLRRRIADRKGAGQ